MNLQLASQDNERPRRAAVLLRGDRLYDGIGIQSIISPIHHRFATGLRIDKSFGVKDLTPLIHRFARFWRGSLVCRTPFLAPDILYVVGRFRQEWT